MPRPRRRQVSVEDTPMYHCCSRVVRRAFLCGQDAVTGKNYDHRRAWVEQRLLLLAEAFAIDVAAYAVMSNHYHLALHADQSRSKSWTDKEAMHRWLKLYKGALLIQRFVKGDVL